LTRHGLRILTLGLLGALAFCRQVHGSESCSEKIDIKGLSSKDALVRLQSIIRLNQCRTTQEGMNALVDTVLKEDNDSVREIGADVLRNMAADAKNAIPRVISVMQNNKLDLAQRCRAARILESIGAQMREVAVPALLKISSDETAQLPLRRSTTLALAGVGRAASDAVPKLAGLLGNSSEDLEVREDALRALTQMGADGMPALPSVSAVLKMEMRIWNYVSWQQVP